MAELNTPIFNESPRIDIMDTISAWGKYAPKNNSWPLRLLISAGLSRGGLRKKILRIWLKQFGNLIDVTVRGIKYRLNIENNVTDRQILAASKEYDKLELNALVDACGGGVFVDIGANIGYYSLVLAQRGARRVIAIEPNPPTLARLRYNVDLNSFNEEITILPIGIGQEGSFELYSCGDLGSASLLAPKAEKINSVAISTRPLLDVLNELKIESLGGIKIDVEGMEDRALLPFFEDAPETLWPTCIVIEHCNKSYWETDIITHLLESGYTKSHETRGNTVLKKAP
jgi:FkbM family methyltransferase